MTELRQELGDGIALNPDAPQPPFPVWMSLPARWSVLDTNPATWRRSADTLIDTTFRGARLSAAHRRDVLGVIEGLVADVQASGACVSLIVAGRRPGGGAATLGMHLAFADDGVPASLARVAETVPRAGTRTELTTPVGPALLQRERMTMAIPRTTTLAALTSLQVFIPIPGTTWTAVLATACAFPELTDRLEQLLVGVAGSIRLRSEADEAAATPGGGTPLRSGGDDTGTGGAGNARGHGGEADGTGGAAGTGGIDGLGGAVEADGADGADEAYRPARGSGGPGIERGFRTMIVKRFGSSVLEPDEPTELGEPSKPAEPDEPGKPNKPAEPDEREEPHRPGKPNGATGTDDTTGSHHG